MRISRVGILILISLTVLIGTNCAYYNRIIARKNLVDGAKAYKDKKFKEAEQLFRDAVERDPEGTTEEGRTAQLFLARTIHSQYVGNRNSSLGDSDFLGEYRLDLAKKLWAKGDPVSEYLFGHLTPETQQLYQDYNSLDPSSSDLEGLKKKSDFLKRFISGLASDLNKVITGGQSIYDEGRFAKVTLSEFTKKFMAENPNPTGEALTRLNRLLLEDAYPNEISKKPKAEDAIDAYKKVLAKKIDDNASFKAVANLLENLGKEDEWLKWVTERANNQQVPPEQRAEAFTSLAARKYSCANEISDVPALKSETTRGSERVYTFKKPENPEDFEKLKQCTEEGLALINKALELNKQAGVESDSTWSYKANLLVQKMRIADMEGKGAERDALKKEAQVAKDKFTELAAEKKKKSDEEEAKKKAQAEAANK
jgi:hypothetical protein